MIPEGKKLILFDGVCNLCNGAIQYVIKNDKENVFLFAALQSDIGEQFVKERKIDTREVDSIILIDPNIAYYVKSTAALKIAYEFGGIWKAVKVFEIIPAKINDLVYDFIARNRYRWFGKQENCMIPTAELKAKFLG